MQAISRFDRAAKWACRYLLRQFAREVLESKTNSVLAANGRLGGDGKLVLIM